MHFYCLHSHLPSSLFSGGRHLPHQPFFMLGHIQLHISWDLHICSCAVPLMSFPHPTPCTHTHTLSPCPHTPTTHPTHTHCRPTHTPHTPRFYHTPRTHAHPHIHTTPLHTPTHHARTPHTPLPPHAPCCHTRTPATLPTHRATAPPAHTPIPLPFNTRATCLCALARTTLHAAPHTTRAYLTARPGLVAVGWTNWYRNMVGAFRFLSVFILPCRLFVGTWPLDARCCARPLNLPVTFRCRLNSHLFLPRRGHARRNARLPAPYALLSHHLPPLLL